MDWSIQFFSNEFPDMKFIYHFLFFLFSKGVILESNNKNSNDLEQSESWGFVTRIQSLPLDFSQYNADKLCNCIQTDIMTKTRYGHTHKIPIAGYMNYKCHADFHFLTYISQRDDKCLIEFHNENTESIDEKTFLSFIELCKELFNQFNFVYGAFKTDGAIPYTQEKVLNDTPDILNFYSGQIVDKIGREKLLSIPTRLTEELINGGVMLLMPGEDPENQDRYMQILRNLQENIDFVVESSDSYVWCFSVPGKAQKISEVTHELLNLTEKIFEINDGFFIPTKITFYIKTYTEDIFSYQRYRKSETFSIPNIHEVIDLKKGFSYGDLVNSFELIKIPEAQIKHLWQIRMEGKIKFILKGKELYIDKNSPNDQYAFSPNPWINTKSSAAWRNPFEIKIDSFDYSVTKGSNGTIPVRYNIDFLTHTLIWFRNTDIGYANKKQLESMLAKFRQSFEISHEEDFQV